jgi:uncharacterized protein (DUF1015 family)
VPDIRPFRALRFDPEVVGDLGLIVAPPYDVIAPDLQRTLLARSPRNAVRLDLPQAERGDELEEPYRRVARTFAAWRSDGSLRKDPRSAVYAYEQAYRIPGTSHERTQRGFFARLRLESFGPDGGVLPHERTLAAPREDPAFIVATELERVAALPPAIDVRDDDGTRHRLWVLAVDAPGGVAERLAGAAGAAAVFIADGHHRYETALRYRDERRMTRSCEPDPPFDFILALLLATTAELTVLPTHRVIRDLGPAGIEGLSSGLDRLFSVSPTTTEALVARFGAAGELAGGEGRMGLVTRDGAWLLEARRSAFPRVNGGGDAVRSLDVTLLGTGLDALAGIDAAAVAGGERIRYTKSAVEAAALVADGTEGADAAFLLEPTPVASILAVARDGDVMPQKSTYFYPKALTGLVLNPHEW